MVEVGAPARPLRLPLAYQVSNWLPNKPPTVTTPLIAVAVVAAGVAYAVIPTAGGLLPVVEPSMR